MKMEGFLARIERLSEKPDQLRRLCENLRTDLPSMLAVAHARLHDILQEAQREKPDETIAALQEQYTGHALRIQTVGTEEDVHQSRETLPALGAKLSEARAALYRYQGTVKALVNFISVAESMHERPPEQRKNYARILDGLLAATGGWMMTSMQSKPRHREFNPQAVEVLIHQLDVDRAVNDPAFWQAYGALVPSGKHAIYHAVLAKRGVDLEKLRPTQKPSQED